jgi:hypothetical protein
MIMQRDADGKLICGSNDRHHTSPKLVPRMRLILIDRLQDAVNDFPPAKSPARLILVPLNGRVVAVVVPDDNMR